MEKPSLQDHDHAHAREDKEEGQKYPQFKGIRLRKWGSWVSEIRMPKSREKLWLGSYPSAQQAARAYDAAVYCLRGPKAKFNFPNSVPNIPSASSLSRRQIQVVAAKYALDRLPSSPIPLQSISYKATEEAESQSKLASVSETELSSDSHQISEEQELDLFEVSDGNDGCLGLNLERISSIEEVSALEVIHSTWQEQPEVDLREYLFEVSNSNGNDGCLGWNLERMPSIEEVSALELICSTWQNQNQDQDQDQKEGHMNILIDPTELWNF